MLFRLYGECMRLKEKINSLSKYELIALLFLTAQLILIFIFNIVCAPRYIDCDSAKLMEHIIKMWEHKTLAIDNWYYSTTIEWDCTAMFAIPFYAITKNIFFACACSNLILAIIFAWTVVFIFGKEKRMASLIALSMIFFPWKLGTLEYFNMMFFAGAQYIVKVTTPLMLVGLLLYIVRNDTKEWWKKRGFMAMLIAFAFYLFVTTASSSVYVCATAVFPVVMVYILFRLKNWEKIKSSEVTVAIVMFVTVILGFIINHAILGGTRGDSMTYMSDSDVLENIRSGFLGIFQLFDAATPYEGAAVFDYYGIRMMVKLLFVVSWFICAIVILSRIIRGKAVLRDKFLMGIFLWNWFILMITDTRAGSQFCFEYRYFIIGVVPLILAASLLVFEYVKSMKAPKTLLFSVFLFLMTLIYVVEYREVFSYGEQNPNVYKIVDYFKDTDYERIYIFYETNEADKLRLVGNPKHYIDIMDDGKTWAYDFYDWYENGPIFPEGSALIVKKDFGFEEDTDFFGYHIVKYDEVGDYDIFSFVDYN